MKRIIPLLSLFMSILLMSGTAWGATWYVDGWAGDDSNDGDSSEEAFETIRRGLNRCSNGDTIKLYGELVEAPWDTTWSGSNPWDSAERTIQISVDKSNLTITNYVSNTPVIYGYSPDAPNDDNDYIMRIDNTGNTFEMILFDGYYDDVGGGDVWTYFVIYPTPDADYTEISNCEFTNFGYNFGDPGHSNFWTILGGGYSRQDTLITNVNFLENYEISDNVFSDNPFEGWGSHEIYISSTKNSEIKRNQITNNGEGDPPPP